MQKELQTIAEVCEEEKNKYRALMEECRDEKQKKLLYYQWRYYSDMHSILYQARKEERICRKETSDRMALDT